jgi:hypothetical protein
MDSFIASMAVLMDTGKYSHFSIHQEPFLSGTFADKRWAMNGNKNNRATIGLKINVECSDREIEILYVTCGLPWHQAIAC